MMEALGWLNGLLALANAGLLASSWPVQPWPFRVACLITIFVSASLFFQFVLLS